MQGSMAARVLEMGGRRKLTHVELMEKVNAREARRVKRKMRRKMQKHSRGRLGKR